MPFAQPRQALGHQKRGFASGGDVTVSTSGAAPASSAVAANSSVAPFTGNSYETLPPATAIAPVTNTPRPYSSAIANMPTSALSGGAGSNGIIAAVNSQGIPQGSPNNAPNVIPNSSFAPPVPPASAATANSSTIAPGTSLETLFGEIPSSQLNSILGAGGQSAGDAVGNIGAGIATTFGQLPVSQQQGIQQYASQNTLAPVPQGQSIFSMYKKGGPVHPRKLAGGGIPTAEAMDPFYARVEERQGLMAHPEGLFGSTGAGRTDVHNMNVPTGSYVVPADVVSGLSEGNTLGGAAIIDRMMHSNPYGIEGGGRRGGGMGPPRAAPQRIQSQSSGNLNMENRGGPIKRAGGGSTDTPPRPKEKPMYLDPRSMPTPSVNKLASVLPQNVASTLQYSQKVPATQDSPSNTGTPSYGGYAKGGTPQTNHNLVPIVVAGGEYLIHPGTIIQKFGNLKKGHAALDSFVKKVRAKTVKETSKLPGPKK